MKPAVMKTAILFGCAATAAAALINCGGRTPGQKYAQALTTYGPVIRNSAKADDRQFFAAVAALRGITARHRTWPGAADVQLVIGGMYAGRRQFEAARGEFERVYVNFPEKREQCARAFFLRGITFEEQGDWKSAAKEFEMVMAQYRETRSGLEVPLYVAAHYRNSSQNEEAAQACDRAVRNYLYIIEDNPYGRHIPLVAQYLMAAYAARGRWDEAVKNLEGVAAKFPDSEGAALCLYYESVIYHRRLNRPDEAEKLLERVIKNYPAPVVKRQAEMAYLGLLAERGATEKTRELLARLGRDYANDGSFCAAARYTAAAGFEKAGQWDEALAEYRGLQAKYPLSLETLRSYLAVAHYSLRNNQPEATEAPCESAVACGRKILEGKLSRPAAIETYRLLSTAYSMRKKWNEGLAVLEEFIQKYPQEPETAAALFQKGTIYYSELQNGERAREAFNLLIQRFPGHQLAPVARSLLGEMEKSAAVQ